MTPPIALLLDFDGTLVPIAPTPDGAVVGDDLRQAVAAAIERLEGRVAIISGRSLEQLDALWGRALWPVTVAASHGLELRHDGHRRAPPPARIFARLARAADARFGAAQGVVIELKSYGLGLHYRLAPRLRPLVKDWAEECAAAHDLVIQEGDMVFELRSPGADKGDALRAIMALAPFHGASPLYIGDDFTDIAAINAARALGGRGLAVGARIAAHADGVLESPETVVENIRALAAGAPAAFIT
ncbi:trehalose-phosphatase [Erythrobacter sp. CCH5-A1]|jgi:trehalose 6-phosphate phosphatase|uniref:trehalose-phosphatase n=1 Tax=Erythrobacter sp. CCH5-A1 TaxID=1768792 RepID=UPI00082C5E1A|nr:trehalose-phosphatase [Erythrobacter sp. CCH5-A1]